MIDEDRKLRRNVSKASPHRRFVVEIEVLWRRLQSTKAFQTEAWKKKSSPLQGLPGEPDWLAITKQLQSDADKLWSRKIEPHLKRNLRVRFLDSHPKQKFDRVLVGSSKQFFWLNTKEKSVSQ